MDNHICEFPEILIEEADEDDNLKAGMQVLTPCPECKETPKDYLDFIENRQKELQSALLAYEPLRPLYHWAPASRRKQIMRYGLRPGMRPTTSVGAGYKIPYICFADSPSWAWALSGDTRWSAKGEWDLWMAWLDKLIDPVVFATDERHSGLYEVRTEHRVYKRNLWYVGSRVKK